MFYRLSSDENRNQKLHLRFEKTRDKQVPFPFPVTVG